MASGYTDRFGFICEGSEVFICLSHPSCNKCGWNLAFFKTALKDLALDSGPRLAEYSRVILLV